MIHMHLVIDAFLKMKEIVCMHDLFNWLPSFNMKFNELELKATTFSERSANVFKLHLFS